MARGRELGLDTGHPAQLWEGLAFEDMSQRGAAILLFVEKKRTGTQESEGRKQM